MLNAQQTYLNAAVIRVQSDANRLSDTAVAVGAEEEDAWLNNLARCFKKVASRKALRFVG